MATTRLVGQFCKASIVFISFLFVSNVSNASASTDTILARYRRYFLSSTSIKSIDSIIPAFAFNLTALNQWPDIDYLDKSPSYWPTRNHLGRIEMLSIAWTNPASVFYKNFVVWKTITRALDNWIEKRYENSNWWVNEIGVPQDMRDILVLIGEDLPDLLRTGALEVLAQHKVRGVGANLIWSADLAIHYGALINDEEMIKHSVDLIAREIKVSNGEGIQPDYSYHQHDERLQIYHYGKSFLETNVRIAWEMNGTAWAFPKDKINILTNFVINGWQWMSRGINTVPGTIDRAASRQDQLHNADIRSLIPYLSELNPSFRPVFTSIAERQNGTGVPLTGFRYFPYSDFAAYHQNNFSFFLKTISTRTLKSESINTENVKGRLLNNGDSYLISNGNEYFNLMPNWNWNFLPGQTNINSAKDTIIRMSYAGSVSDGNYGLTAMDYAVNGNGTNISAHKFWACDGRAVVCLISGLKATGVTDSIFTALDQSLWQSPVEVNEVGHSINTPGKNLLSNVKWIHHANCGYILLQPSTVQLQLKVVTSSWSAINLSASAVPVTKKVFMPLLYNSDIKDTSTGYVLVNAVTAKEVMGLAIHPKWKILHNTSDKQVVQFDDGVIMAAFYSAGSATLQKNKTIAVDKPCLIQLTNDRIFVSDPLHKGGVVNLKLNSKAYVINLSSDGSTVSVKQ